MQSPVTPLVLTDESLAGPFVTGSALRLPLASVDEALAAIAEIKTKRKLPICARIHCRVLFAGDARRKSPFRVLHPDGVHELLAECVTRMLALGGSWWGAWANRSTYPQQLQMVAGKPFSVTAKHLAGM